MKLRQQQSTPNSTTLASLLGIVLLANASFATGSSSSLAHKLAKRQVEQETQPGGGGGGGGGSAPTSVSQANNNNPQQQQPARLYPDLARPFASDQQLAGPPFNEHPAAGQHLNQHHGGPTPFLPFGNGLQAPNLPIRLNADQQPAPFGRVLPVPRPTTAAERLQSQSFADGLGRRLMSMIGLNLTSSSPVSPNQEQGEPNNSDQQQQQPGNMLLHNATVLQQLGKGVNSIYNGLSRMYNSTVQEQLNLLQMRYKSETANSTNNRHEMLAEQVPQFFRQMASKLGEAQDQLNKVWRNIQTANHSSPGGEMQPNRPVQSRNFIDSFLGGPMETQFIQPAGQFFSQQVSNVRDFWGSQVQPQVQMVHRQLARVWQDLASSGALVPAESLINRSRNNGLNSTPNNRTATSSEQSNLIDGLLKEIDQMSPEYSLIDAKSETNQGDSLDSSASNKTTAAEQQQQHHQAPKLSLQMQNGLINAQRELNKAWLGLSSSIQNALGNVRQTLEPRPTFSSAFQWAHPNNHNNQQQPQQQHQPDPAENEISGKIQDLSKLQRNADLVNEALQQQQRETQQRNLMFTGMDRFKSFFNQNFDLGRNFDELPNRVGDSISRFGMVVGDLWNQVPERWDNFVSNMKPTQAPQLNANLLSSTSETPKSSNDNKPTN